MALAHCGADVDCQNCGTPVEPLEANMMNPTRFGAALAVTVGIAYAACALVFWTWPEASAQFMNALFHGLDFRKLQSGPSTFGFESFSYAFVGVVVWAFLLGCLFGWLANRFAVRG